MKSTTAPPTPDAPKADAAALAALATTRTPTGLPPATVTPGQTAAVLTATQPTTPGAVGKFDADQVKTALGFAAQVVAATRADRDYLCGPVSADPLTGLSTPGLRDFLADPANKDNKRAIEQPISGANDDQNCGPLRWAGPGVVPGPQTWQAAPGTDGADLTVTWEGIAGYVLVDGNGNAEPWGLDARGVYGLVRTADGWLLDSWDGTTFGSLDQGWPHDAPIPDGYLPTADGSLPAADPDALDAVRGAADTWQQQPASTMTVEQSNDDPGDPDDERDQATALNASVDAAPSRGDASGTVSLDTEQGDRRRLWLDRGRRSLGEATGDEEPRPGRSLPKPTRWIGDDATDPSDGGVSFPVNPFAIAALLASTGAAAVADCPPGRQAAACCTAVVATARPAGTLPVETDQARRAGHPYLVLNVGLDKQGRPAFVLSEQQARAFGKTYAVLKASVEFGAYPTDAPPPVEPPDPNTVASGDDIRH